MKRKINQTLKNWRNNPRRKPLLIRGARQVGKTYSILEHGKTEYDSCAHLDFLQMRQLSKIFEGDLIPQKMLTQMEVEISQRILPGKTLLFLDEIQECPRAIVALRYFYEQMPELHIIAAGSLLELALEKISIPVGRVEFLFMYPMDFEEFLGALGEALLTQHLPIGHFTAISLPISESIHEKILEHLRYYFLVGGMPEAVKVFSETRSLLEVFKVHQLLCQGYLEDFSKHRGEIDLECVSRIFAGISQKVGAQIKYTELYPEKRIEVIKASLHFLMRLMIVHPVYATAGSGLPLGAAASGKIFKCLFLDIGLMQHLCGVTAQNILGHGDLTKVYQGALAEQFVGQALLVGGDSAENGKLYYWARAKRSSNAEVDFLWVEDGVIVPIEVKNSPSGRLKSLHLFLKEHTGSPRGLVLTTRNAIEWQDPLLFLPLYAKFS
ncbi:MAG: ATP-binding protein [Gammaproteobacteria bacterium]|nr:ATP-binding protein [Gammaproteobacteria bacterium]